jgi:hypothetical protein
MFFYALVFLFNAYFAMEQTTCVCEAQLQDFVINCSDVQTQVTSLQYLKDNSCASNCAIEGCKRNYLIIQAHHDYCLPFEIPIEIQTEIHDFEEVCEDCYIKRKYNPDLPSCDIQPNCSSSSLLIDVVVTLASNNCSFACTDNMICGSAFRTLRSLHDICPEDSFPQVAEELIHLYEESCATMDCNTGFPNDVLQCSGSEFSSSMIVLLLVPFSLFYL